jgi:hypothetical protein
MSASSCYKQLWSHSGVQQVRLLPLLLLVVVFAEEEAQQEGQAHQAS